MYNGRSSSHRSARNRFLFFFLCPPKNKDQRAQHKNRSRFLLVYVCSFFSFFLDVLRLHHRFLLLRLRLRHRLLLRYSTTMLDLCVSAVTTIHSFIHSFIHSLVCIPPRIWLSGNEQK